MSAFIAAGPPSRVIEEAIDGNLELVLLEPTLSELERILTEKLGFGRESRQAVEELLRDVAVETTPTPEAPRGTLTGDPDDDLILVCAVGAHVDVLVSGDKRHLLSAGEYRGVRILSPQALLAEPRRS